MYDAFVTITVESWQVLALMAPYLLFGFLVAGVLSVCVSPERVERHLGGHGFGPVLKASLFGVPLPLCSCGVIPVSASLRRHGASRAATTSFLLSTPQTGVDSIAVTYALLGPVFAIFRPIVALLTGFLGGGLVHMFGEPRTEDEIDRAESPACAEACCAADGGSNPVWRALRYGFVTLPADIGVVLLIGILIAGALAVLVPPGQLAPYVGGGVLSILLLMAAGVPVYVCATASVPIAAGFMHMGASPGAALAFLIAGPATNAAAFTTIWKVLGRRSAAVYLLTVAGSAIACGLLLDWLFPAVVSVAPLLAGHEHAAETIGWFYHASAIALLVVLAYSYWSTARSGGHASEHAEEVGAAAPASEMRIELLVDGMNCTHCADSVRRVLSESPGVRAVEVDLASGRGVVRGDGLNREELLTAVTSLGYSLKFSPDASQH